MTVRSALIGVMWAAAWALGACNAGDVAVFADVAAGTAGSFSGQAGGSSGSGAADAGAATGGAAGSLAGLGGNQAGVSGAPVEAAAGAPDVLCHSNLDCPRDWLCLKQACSDMEGECEPRPVCFDMSPAPVCGCNHVTYWNDCLRRQSGVSASASGECGAGAHACFKSNDCNDGATCSHLLPPMGACGGPPEPGTCWVTPPDCGAVTEPRRWQLCDSPPPPGGAGSPAGGAPTSCLSTCQAVQSGHSAMPMSPGSACP